MDSQKLAAVRNRENQRKSRARRRDYIHELEARIRQHESAGVRATAEIQTAARKVAEENIRLRSLLGLYGVEGRSLEEFLEQGNTSSASKLCPGQASKPNSSGDHLAPRQACVSIPEHAIASSTATAGESMVEAYDQAERPLDPSIQPSTPGGCCVNSDTRACCYKDDAESLCSAGLNADLLPASYPERPSDPIAQHCEASNGSNGQCLEAGDEISCVAAAEIIASMRGQTSPEDVLPELGCTSSKNCMVKKMAVFQIMDSG